MNTDANKALVRRQFEELWNHHNLDVADELYSPAYVGHWYPYPPVRGPQMMKRLAIMLRTGFPDSISTIEDMIAEGDQVATRYSFRGTHTGDYQGYPPTGKSVEMTGIVISRIANGQFVEEWANPDFLGQRQQLGLVPLAPRQTSR